MIGRVRRAVPGNATTTVSVGATSDAGIASGPVARVACASPENTHTPLAPGRYEVQAESDAKLDERGRVVKP